MSVRIKVGISEKVFNEIKKQFEEGKAKNPQLYPFLTVEDFIDNILNIFSKSSEQLKGMESKMGEIINMMGGDLGPDFDLSKIFEKKPEAKKDQKNDKKDSKNLKS